MENLKIGFIGLGEMGKPMAENLIKNHFHLTVCGHRRKGPVQELKSRGAEVARTPRELSESSDVIVIMIRDIPQANEVLFGEGFWKGKGIWQGSQSASKIILSSTLQPGYCRQAAKKLKEKGLTLLDSPVSGGRSGAEAGTLTFMVGGEKRVFDKCLPVFEAMGDKIYYLGKSGLGQAIKLINNYMMIVTAHGTSESITMGLKAGLKLDTMLEIIKVSSGNSAVIEHWDLLAKHQKEYKCITPDDKSIFSKDIKMALDFADEMGVKAQFGELVLKSGESSLFPVEI
jgi:3-hydroxyisobutyrate dehydrogenase-like beta-hydroxyacid dehydrogenase